jgi:hypothetical protein
MRLPICLHLAVLFAAEVGAFLTCGALAMLLWTGPSDTSNLVRSAAYAAYLALPSFVGWLAAGALVRAGLHARCPMCGGPARCRSWGPIAYTCQACGHVHTSGTRWTRTSSLS